MKKATMFFAAVFLLSFSVLLFAQDDGVKDSRYGGFARLHSMGDNPYIVDPDNIKTNPAYISSYANFLWGDIGASTLSPDNGTGQFVGFNFGLNRDVTLGILLTRDDFGSTSIGSIDPMGLVNSLNGLGANIVPLNNNLQLNFSYELGDLALGLGVAYASTTNDFQPATGSGDKNTASQIGANLGLLGYISPTFKFDFGFSIALPSGTFEPGTGDKLEGSNTLMLANARGFITLSKHFTLVPNLAFYNASGTVKSAGQSVDYPSMMGILAGVGLSYRNGNLLISGGPAFTYESTTFPAVENVNPELKDSRMYFPSWNLGAEWYFTEWLVGRAGYVASTFSETSQSTATPTTFDENTRTRFSEGDVRLGVGFRFGGFTLDATVNDDVLREGFNLVGGGTKSFAYLSASFAF
ncbi:MAG: hypothetical protein KGZ85_10170 [Ignavibacterium sp.]|nr:hypothetical protein [Ignavibacterium sp.]